jgi:hypothetical protein
MTWTPFYEHEECEHDAGDVSTAACDLSSSLSDLDDLLAGSGVLESSAAATVVSLTNRLALDADGGLSSTLKRVGLLAGERVLILNEATARSTLSVLQQAWSKLSEPEPEDVLMNRVSIMPQTEAPAEPIPSSRTAEIRRQQASSGRGEVAVMVSRRLGFEFEQRTPEPIAVQIEELLAIVNAAPPGDVEEILATARLLQQVRRESAAL